MADPQQGMEAAAGIIDIVLKVGGILAGVLVLFFRKDQSAMTRLLEAVPEIWAVIEQERRRAQEGKATATKASTNPLQRGLELAKERKGSPLNAKETVAVTQALQAQHERNVAIGKAVIAQTGTVLAHK